MQSFISHMHTTVLCYIVTVILRDGCLHIILYVAKVMGDYLAYLCVYVTGKLLPNSFCQMTLTNHALEHLIFSFKGSHL